MNALMRVFVLFAAAIVLIAIPIAMLSPLSLMFGPVAYDWDLRLSSPDKAYDLVVIRGDAAAFDDFTYHIYLFPHASAPADLPKGSAVDGSMIRDNGRYLVYSGYNYPMFRWTGSRTLEVDLSDSYILPFEFEPVKRVGTSDEAVLISLAFGREDVRNALP